jgi:glycosyltransferase involved in cell wall biosynthesis
VLESLAAKGGRFDDGYNIIVPAWELPSYPKEWSKQLARFDEVWALSTFIQKSLATAKINAPLIGQSVQIDTSPLLPRRYYRIRESAFVLLNFFDLSSYATRKNPEAVLALMDRIRADDPFRDVQLVLKAKNGERGAEEWAASLRPDPRIRLITDPLDSFELAGLINACDCFVSLHRSEGFGRGLGEAMMLGRLAMGTGWSGNVDFMTPENSLLVRSRLVKLKRDSYPHWKGQSWAEPDVDHAYSLLRPILDDPARGREVAKRGQAEVFRSHGHRAVGLRILDRLERIVAEASPKPVAALA